MPSGRRTWAQKELLVVFRLYCRTPFGRLHQRNPEIVELADMIGRTPGAVAMKACNFASLDPLLQARNIAALGNVSRADRELWQAFKDDSSGIAQEAEVAYASLTGEGSEDFLPELGFQERGGGLERSASLSALSEEPRLPEGPSEIPALQKRRRIQSFFRAAVLSSYNNRCALTDLAIPELLNASHIIPWREDEKRRADPRNGICLNAFHDRAFDRGFISFDEQFRVMVSDAISCGDECQIVREQLAGLVGHALRQPERFLPEPEALAYHREHVFQRHKGRRASA